MLRKVMQWILVIHVVLQLILNDEEVKIKTAMWMRQNADFLKEMKGIYSMLYLMPSKYRFNVVLVVSTCDV